MEQIRKLTAELLENCEANIHTLKNAMKVYEMAKLGYDLQEQRSKEIYTRVLSEHEFYASIDCIELGVKAGDRIIEDKYDYLLSEEDFQKLLKLARPLHVKEGITNNDGVYIVNYHQIKVEAMNSLVDFIIQYILPQSIRQEFWLVRRNVVREKQLISIIATLPCFDGE